MRLTLFWRMARMLPTTIVSTAAPSTSGSHSARNCGEPNVSKASRASTPNAAALTPTAISPVIAVGAPLGQGFAAFREAFARLTDRTPGMDEAAFQTAVAPETFVARRDRIGGPAEPALLAALTSYADAAWVARQVARARQNRHDSAQQTLNSAFDALLAKD